MGETWSTQHFETREAHVFISPKISDPKEVLAILAHELVHVVDDCRSGHQKDFVTIARAVGLIAPWTSSVPGPDLTDKIKRILKVVPKYGQPAYKAVALEKKKQSTRMLLLECDACGCKIRTTKIWIETYPVFTCPCGTPMKTEDKNE